MNVKKLAISNCLIFNFLTYEKTFMYNLEVNLVKKVRSLKLCNFYSSNLWKKKYVQFWSQSQNQF